VRRQLERGRDGVVWYDIRHNFLLPVTLQTHYASATCVDMACRTRA